MGVFFSCWAGVTLLCASVGSWTRRKAKPSSTRSACSLMPINLCPSSQLWGIQHGKVSCSSRPSAARFHVFEVKIYPDDIRSHAQWVPVHCLHLPTASPTRNHLLNPNHAMMTVTSPSRPADLWLHLHLNMMFKCKIFDTILEYAPVSSVGPIPSQ